MPRKDKPAAASSADERVEQPHGGALLRKGLRGNRGGGRKPDEFRKKMRALSTWAEKQGFIEDVLKDPEHPHWASTLKLVIEQGYGKAEQSVTHRGSVAIEHMILARAKRISGDRG